MFGRVRKKSASGSELLEVSFKDYSGRTAEGDRKNKACFEFYTTYTTANGKTYKKLETRKYIKNSAFVLWWNSATKAHEYLFAESTFNKLFKSFYDPEEKVNNGYGHRTYQFEPIVTGVTTWDTGTYAMPKQGNRRDFDALLGKVKDEKATVKKPATKKEPTFSFSGWLGD